MNEINLKSNTQSRNFSNYEANLESVSTALGSYAESVQKIQDTIAPTLIAYADKISKILESQDTFEIDDLQKTALDFFDEEFLSSIPHSLETLDEIIPTTPETESLKAEVATMKKSFAEKITIENIIQFFTIIDFVCKLIGIQSPFDEPSQIINETTNINIQIVDHDCTEGIIETLDMINNSETIE